MSLKFKIVLILFMLFNLMPLGPSYANKKEPIFQLVMIDKKTENKLGNFPYDREVYAKAIKILKESGARAVVVKFFLVNSRSEKGDQLFADAIRKIPVFLQASLDDLQTNTSNLPDRFTFKNITGDLKNIYEAKSGLIPLGKFSVNSFDTGFINARNTDFVPLIVNYKGKIYKSVYFSILSYLFPDNLFIESGKYLRINNKKLELNQFNEVKIDFPKEDKISYLSFADFLNYKFNKNALKNKIIILAYDVDDIHTLKTKIGMIKAHRAFYYILESFYKKIAFN